MDPFVVLDCAKFLPNRFALPPRAAERFREARGRVRID